MNHIGEKYGSYTIVEETNQRSSDGHRIYKAVCDCGAERSATLSNIKYQANKKCPHYAYIGDLKVPYGTIKNNRIKDIFFNMLRRCYDSSNGDYKSYGNKGITIYKEWIENPALFEEWSLNNGYKYYLTIDRIKEDEGYFPSNCRWVTRAENTRYKSNTNYITATVTLSGRLWASLIPDIGINYINTLVRERGEEVAVKFIEDKLKNKHDIVVP